MAVPENLRYTRDHTWVLVKGKEATMGITEFAQKKLGEVVYVDSPKVGITFDKDEEMGTIESIKAVSEIFSPLSGTVSAKNELTVEDPPTINEDPYGDGWIFKLTITKPDEVKELLTAAEYDELCKGEA
jgi:glycine cleavage system H protein